MIKQFEKLSFNECELIFKAPALISVLMSSSLNKINAARKADAIKLAHLKTFTANPALIPFYMAVEKDFKEQFETIVKQYAPFDTEQRDALKKEIEDTGVLIDKLDKEYARLLNLSLDRYAKHVAHGDRTVLEYFIFPYPIPGLTD